MGVNAVGGPNLGLGGLGLGAGGLVNLQGASAPSGPSASEIFALLGKGASQNAGMSSSSGAASLSSLQGLGNTVMAAASGHHGVSHHTHLPHGGLAMGLNSMNLVPGTSSSGLIPGGLSQQAGIESSSLDSSYGLVGLLQVIKSGSADSIHSNSGPKDLSMLAIGTDLHGLSLNLASSDQLFPSFAHPWAEVPVAKEPVYILPNSYRMSQPALKTGHLAKFHESTLLYMFYAMPRDILQAYAAQELYSREWKYHTELKAWFKKDSGQATDSKTPGTSAQQSAWHYWDLGSWSARPYAGAVVTVPASQLAAGFLHDDDAKVKHAAAQPAAVGTTSAPAPSDGIIQR